MQRTRFFTVTARIFSVTGEEAGTERAAALPWVPALAGLLVLATGAAIAVHPNTPVWDQARLLEARFQAPWYPAPPFGFTAQLLVVALRPFAADPGGLDTLVRVVAMALWAGAATWLATGLLTRRSLQAALVLALFTSQFPLLWLSTELVAGALLCLALAAWVRGAPAWATGITLALLALGKPDLLLVALTLLGVFAWQRRASAPGLAAGFAGALAVLLLPGLVALGPGYLTSYGADGGGRGFASFTQHLAALLAPFQLAAAPNPWAEPQPYLERVFPGASSFGDVLRAPGLPYLDFVALSLAKGLRKLGWTFHWAWLAVPLLVFARRRAHLGLDARERAILWTCVGCVPFVLFAYPHIRYFARYLPLFWLLLLLSLEKLLALPAARQPRHVLWAAGLALLLALAENVNRASLGLALADRLDPYWFPD